MYMFLLMKWWELNGYVLNVRKVNTYHLSSGAFFLRNGSGKATGGSNQHLTLLALASCTGKPGHGDQHVIGHLTCITRGMPGKSLLEEDLGLPAHLFRCCLRLTIRAVSRAVEDKTAWLIRTLAERLGRREQKIGYRFFQGIRPADCFADELTLLGSVGSNRFHEQPVFIAEGRIKAGWLDTESLTQFGNTNTVISPLPE
jgi:hypothetical protein